MSTLREDLENILKTYHREALLPLASSVVLEEAVDEIIELFDQNWERR